MELNGLTVQMIVVEENTRVSLFLTPFNTFILCLISLLILFSALGGKVINSITTTTFALICQDSVRRNVKIEAALRDQVPLVQRAWIDWLIVHVCIFYSCELGIHYSIGFRWLMGRRSGQRLITICTVHFLQQPPQ